MAKNIEGLYEMLRNAAEEEINLGHFQVEEKTVSYLVQYGSRVIMAYLDKVSPISPVHQVEAPKPEEKKMRFVNVVTLNGQQTDSFLSDVPFDRIDISPRALVEKLFGKYFPKCEVELKSYEIALMQKVDSNSYMW